MRPLKNSWTLSVGRWVFERFLVRGEEIMRRSQTAATVASYQPNHSGMCPLIAARTAAPTISGPGRAVTGPVRVS